jgi:hypothetical protein
MDAISSCVAVNYETIVGSNDVPIREDESSPNVQLRVRFDIIRAHNKFLMN